MAKRAKLPARQGYTVSHATVARRLRELGYCSFIPRYVIGPIGDRFAQALGWTIVDIDGLGAALWLPPIGECFQHLQTLADRPVFFPQQLQGGVLMLLQLLVDVNKVRQPTRARGCRGFDFWRNQGRFQIRLC
jgi:hypothetical protein